MQVAEKERMPGLSLGEEKNMVTQLLLVNVTVYIFLFFISVIYRMENYGYPAFVRDILNNIMLPAAPAAILAKPWTVISAMIAQVEVMDIFSNMVWLYCFGTILQNLAGPRTIIPLYLFGSLLGMVFYVAGMNFIPALQPQAPYASIMGSGAAVMALAAGATTFGFKARVFPLLMRGGIPVWVISGIFLALHITAYFTRGLGNPQLLYLAGGAVLGVLYMSQFKKGREWGRFINVLLFNAGHVFHPKAERAAIRAGLDIDPKTATPPQPYTKIGHVPEHKVNELLDKINAQGMHTLSPEEKELLLRASKEREAE